MVQPHGDGRGSSCFFTCDEGMDWPLPTPASMSVLCRGVL